MEQAPQESLVISDRLQLRPHAAVEFGGIARVLIAQSPIL
jgi:hypothetical protein